MTEGRPADIGETDDSVETSEERVLRLVTECIDMNPKVIRSVLFKPPQTYSAATKIECTVQRKVDRKTVRLVIDWPHNAADEELKAAVDRAIDKATMDR